MAHFGAFAVSTRAAGAGRDFRTGARVPIPPTRRAVFRAGVALRDGLNAGAAVLVAGLIGALGWVAVAIGDLKQDVGRLDATIAALPASLQTTLEPKLAASLIASLAPKLGEDLQVSVANVVRGEIGALKDEVAAMRPYQIQKIPLPAAWQAMFEGFDERLKAVELEVIQVRGGTKPQ